MSPAMTSRPRRWFAFSLIGLFLFLSIAITLAAILLLRRGKLPRTGLITGSSMEPVLRGPRFLWTCDACSQTQEFALDTCKSHQPFRCRWCDTLDPKSTVDFEDAESVAEAIRPGDEVRYATLRNMRSLRGTEMNAGTAQANGLIRGDIVVIQDGEAAKREVKRVVGFESEKVAIVRGDVFVDGERWCKTLEQTLRQSILIDAWDRASLSPNGLPQNRSSAFWLLTDGVFEGGLSPSGIENAIRTGIENKSERKLVFSSTPANYLDNQLTVNAHDSHAIVPINDFGIAFQVMTPETAWSIRCQFHSPVCDPLIAIEWSGAELLLKSDAETVRAQNVNRNDQPMWVAIAMVDGYLVAGSQNEEWFRTKLPSKEEALAMEKLTNNSPIEIVPISGNLEIDQLLVFRDIHYRGQGDSETQIWEPSVRLVVLGDNVSSSSDSRDRWPIGLATKAVKGVVLQTESVMEVLLRQRR